MKNGSLNQTKKPSATTEADEGKPKPETYTKEQPNATVRGGLPVNDDGSKSDG